MEQATRDAGRLARRGPRVAEVVDRTPAAVVEHARDDRSRLALHVVGPLALSAQDRVELVEAAQREGPALAAPGRAGLQADPSGVEVDLRPSQAEHLALAPAGQVGERRHGSQVV